MPEGHRCRATQGLNYARMCICLFSIEWVQLIIGFSIKQRSRPGYVFGVCCFPRIFYQVKFWLKIRRLKNVRQSKGEDVDLHRTASAP